MLTLFYSPKMIDHHQGGGHPERPERLEAILEALDRTGGNRTEAARLLGISRRTLQRKLKEMGAAE